MFLACLACSPTEERFWSTFLFAHMQQYELEHSKLLVWKLLVPVHYTNSWLTYSSLSFFISNEENELCVVI